MDFDKVLAAAEEVGIDVLIVEQDQSYETPAIEAVSQSRAFLKSTYGI